MENVEHKRKRGRPSLTGKRMSNTERNTRYRELTKDRITASVSRARRLHSGLQTLYCAALDTHDIEKIRELIRAAEIQNREVFESVEEALTNIARFKLVTPPAG